MKRVHIHVSGFVQGVYFRQNTLATARDLGLRGLVRNLPDGRVEVICEGNQEAIDKMIAWCKKGPGDARVEGLDIEWEELDNQFRDFRIAY
jgi:acylphosphatase